MRCVTCDADGDPNVFATSPAGCHQIFKCGACHDREHPFPREIARAWRKVRWHNRISVTEAARALGMTPSELSGYETGRSEITPEIEARMRAAYVGRTG